MYFNSNIYAPELSHNKLEEYDGYGWKMHGYLKKVIADNGFDFQARMRELNSEN